MATNNNERGGDMAERKQILIDLRKIKDDEKCTDLEAAVILIVEEMDDYFEARTIGERTFTGEMRRRREEKHKGKP
jgi:hypothetical protein